MENNSLMYFAIISSIRTTQDLNQIHSEIDSLLVSIFETRNSFDNSLKSISIESAEKIKEIITKNGLDTTNKEIVRSFLTELKDLLGKFKTIRLIIAFDPSYQTIENIHGWVLSNLGQRYILDIEKDQSVLGGAIIVTSNGEYRDFTVKKSLEEAFEDKREEVIKTLQD